MAWISASYWLFVNTQSPKMGERSPIEELHQGWGYISRYGKTSSGRWISSLTRQEIQGGKDPEHHRRILKGVPGLNGEAVNQCS